MDAEKRLDRIHEAQERQEIVSPILNCWPADMPEEHQTVCENLVCGMKVGEVAEVTGYARETVSRIAARYADSVQSAKAHSGLIISRMLQKVVWLAGQTGFEGIKQLQKKARKGELSTSDVAQLINAARQATKIVETIERPDDGRDHSAAGADRAAVGKALGAL